MKYNFLLAILVTVFGAFLAENVCPGINENSSQMRDKAAQQLTEFRQRKQQINTLTTGYGAPIGDKLNTLTAGPRGPVLLQDVVLLEELAHFARERIPERVVHAKGAGAFGYFNITNDITKYCKAKIFSEVGKVTPVVGRFSTASGESGSADSVRDGRGFAVKFYTEEGNWDLLSITPPVFFIRDPLILPSISRSLKRNPVTHLKDDDMFWDLPTLRPETTFAMMHLFSDSGIPSDYRHMDVHAINTYKMVNENNEPVYCKFHFISNQGTKFLSDEKAANLRGTSPDSYIRDLYDAIANGNYPSWTMYIQVMTFEQAKTYRFNPFDPTKLWHENEFPMIEVGTLTLNKNPSNYFADIEQLGFAPSRMVRGIEPSPDKILQGRLFIYPDTQRYRLGVNFLQIPVNKAQNASVHNYERDGYEVVTDNQDGAPNYYPNSFCGPTSDPAFKILPYSVSGDVDRYNSEDEDNFSQPSHYYREVLGDDEKERMIKRIAGKLKGAKEFLQKRAINNFSQVDKDFGRRIMEQLQKMKS